MQNLKSWKNQIKNLIDINKVDFKFNSNSVNSVQLEAIMDNAYLGVTGKQVNGQFQPEVKAEFWIMGNNPLKGGNRTTSSSRQSALYIPLGDISLGAAYNEYTKEYEKHSVVMKAWQKAIQKAGIEQTRSNNGTLESLFNRVGVSDLAVFMRMADHLDKRVLIKFQ